jgi:hypothetical protein
MPREGDVAAPEVEVDEAVGVEAQRRPPRQPQLP